MEDILRKQIVEKIEEQEKWIAELKADACRYRWLREHAPGLVLDEVFLNGKSPDSIPGKTKRDKLDKMIDEEMKDTE